jgi:hypothetical protein
VKTIIDRLRWTVVVRRAEMATAYSAVHQVAAPMAPAAVQAMCRWAPQAAS